MQRDNGTGAAVEFDRSIYGGFCAIRLNTGLKCEEIVLMDGQNA